MITLKRLEELIAGTAVPDGMGEELFVMAYHSAISDQLLMEVVSGLENFYDQLNQLELELLILGYSMGQKVIRETEEQIDDMVLVKKTFH